MRLNPDDIHIDADISRASTLPAAWYVQAEALSLENQHVFSKSWQYATGLAKVAKSGDFVTVDVAGKSIVILRDQNNVLRGFHNVCRHRAGAVAVGEGHCQALKCAYHGWTYGLDGSLKFTPEMKNVACFEKSDFSLAAVEVDVFGPFVFCRIEAGGPSLAEFLGHIPEETKVLPLERMKFYRRHVYEMNCNWKVYVDNYLEGYHIPQVHPELFRMLSYPEYKVETHRYYSKQHAPVRPAGEKLYKRHLPEGQEPAALYYWLFPNLMLNIYPDNVQINVIVPLGHERTATIFEWYLLDPERPESAEEFAASLEFSDFVQQEDIAICEQVQKGLSSGVYEAGRFSPQRENGVHHFHLLMAEFLKG